MVLLSVLEYEVYDDTASPVANRNQIAAAISAAEAVIAKITDRVFVECGASPVEQIDIVNGKGKTRLYVKQAPIRSVTTVQYWDGVQWITLDSTVQPYSFKADSHIIYSSVINHFSTALNDDISIIRVADVQSSGYVEGGYKFFKGYQNWKVTYTYGYTTFPADLKYACFLIAKQFVLEADRQGLNSQSDGEQNFSYKHDLPATAMAILMTYKITW